jgi:hypothetical protein
VSTATASGDGAANAVAFISGTTATILEWPANSVPTTFTVCSVTRYTGGTRNRILQCDGMNWAHGHYGGDRGVAYYNSPRKTAFPAEDSVGVVDDWLVMCGTNDAGVAVPGNIILDQDEIAVANGGSGGCQLAITTYGSEPSDWALHSVLIWDYSLGTAPVPFHATPYLSIQVTVRVDVSLSMVRSTGVCLRCIRAGRLGTVTRYACNPGGFRNTRALTQPRTPP